MIARAASAFVRVSSARSSLSAASTTPALPRQYVGGTQFVLDAPRQQTQQIIAGAKNIYVSADGSYFITADPEELWTLMDRDWIGIKRREKAFDFRSQ